MDENKDNNTAENETEEQQTFTREEVEKLLQSEADKRVTAALKKANKAKEKAVAEAKKLATMSEEERFQHELEEREQAIAEKEKQLALAQNKAEASKVLGTRGLSAELVELVVAEDADTMLANINLLESAFKASVKKEVENRLSSSTPKKNLPLDGSIDKAAFRKMPLSQQALIAREQPELYKQLTKH